MVKILQNSFLLFVWFFLPGCCKDTPDQNETDTEELLPIWSVKLPGEAGIYNDGLIGLPVYKDQILFHSTYFTNTTEEDNRMHALDIETGQLKWTFPVEYLKSEPMFFWGVPYIFQNYLIVKMPAFDDLTSRDRIVCIDLENHQSLWSLTLPESLSRFTSRDIVGKFDKFWFFQQAEKGGVIFEGNVLTGDTVRLTSIESSDFNLKTAISSNNSVLATINGYDKLFYATKEYSGNGISNFNCYLNVFDISSRMNVTKLPIEGDPIFTVNNLKFIKNKLFFTRGRTAYCFDCLKNEICWTFQSYEDADFAAPGVLVDNDVVFLWGTNRFIGLNAISGKKIYQGNIECGNADVYGGNVYIIGRDGKLYVLNINNGRIISIINSPEFRSGDSYFSTGCKPQVHHNKLFLFGRNHAFCYPAFPETSN
jgi:outer membrane protein assembly factor BamB